MHKIFIEDSNEFEEDKSIVTTIKELPEDKQHKSNAEIEKKELVLRAGLDALHKAVGKSHAGGGVKVKLNEGDFVYSADPSMNITKGEAKLFELKMPSSKKKRNWTPAKMVEKNIDVKDYNRLISVLNDKDSDEISKTSSTMMLQKYVNTLGSIAYLQEAKKGEPTPPFAEGVAPVYDTALKSEMDKQPQYMRRGGTFQRGGSLLPRVPYYAQNDPQAPAPLAPYGTALPTQLQMNPALPGYMQPIAAPPQLAPRRAGRVGQTAAPMPVNATGQGVDYNDLYNNRPITPPARAAAGTNRPQTGIWSGDRFPSVNPKTGAMSAEWNAMTGYKDIYDYAKAVGYTGPIDKNNFAKSAKDVQNFVIDNYPDLVNQYHAPAPTGYGQPRAGQPADEKLGVRWANIAKSIASERGLQPTSPLGRTDMGTINGGDTSRFAPPAAPVVAGTTAQGGPNPQYAGNTVLPYNPSIPLSPLQSLNVLYSGAQALTVPKFYPMRPQVDSPLVELEKLNPAAQINQANSAAFQAYRANSIMNPVVAAANNANVYGRNLEAVNQIQSQYDNQNVQIANQQNLANNQIQRQDQQQNIAFNQRYYDQTQTTEQNYLDERRMATNQTVGLYNKYRSQNDALSTSLQGQRMYTKPVLDRNGQPRLDANGQPIMQAAPLFDVDNSGWSPQIYNTGAGGLDNVPTQPNSGNVFEQAFQAALNAGVDRDKAYLGAVKMATSAPAIKYSQSQYQKKGGPIKRQRKSK